MLEQLLQRIALKGAATQDDGVPVDVTNMALRAADGQHSGYPALAINAAPAKTKPELDPAAAARAAAAWTRAKLAYQLACTKGTLQQVPVDCFVGFTPTHRAVAALLWSQRRSAEAGILSIYSPQGVVAYVHLQERSVLLRQNVSPAELAALHCKVVPEPHTALPAVSKTYAATSINMLLWFYGQTTAAATDLVSHSLIQQPMHLRKLPCVDAKALELRHLSLIQRFSAGAFYFDSLQRQMGAQDARWLCADLASLYLVGVLSVAPLSASGHG
jgi:hypothetical protein